MKNFKIGDEVTVIRTYGRAKKDLKGVIVTENCGRAGVRFFEYMEGHNLDGKCEQGYGQWVTEECLSLSRITSWKDRMRNLKC